MSVFARILAWFRRRSTTVVNPTMPQAGRLDPQAGPSDLTEQAHVTVLDGIPIPELTDVVSGVIFADGNVIEHDVKRYVTLSGSGTIVDSLAGDFTVCALCAAEAERLLIKGDIPLSAARTTALCPTELIQRSTESGVPLCPRHARHVARPDGTVVVLSTEELEAVQLQQPLGLLLRLVLRPKQP